MAAPRNAAALGAESIRVFPLELLTGLTSKGIPRQMQIMIRPVEPQDVDGVFDAVDH